MNEEIYRETYIEVPVKPATYYSGMYGMHKYWGKKPYNIVDFFIEMLSEPGDVVLDPFCGSGVIPIEVAILGRRAIGLDLSPVAVFIARNTYRHVNITDAQKLFASIEAKVKDRINELYTTKCPFCGRIAIGTHYIWSDGKLKRVWFKCPHCRREGKKEPEEEDLKLVEEISKKNISYWYPNDEILVNSRINVNRRIKVSELFTHRNLLALSMLYDEIERITDDKLKEFFKFIFTSALPQASKMVFVIRKRGRTKGEIRETEEVGSWVAGYWIPKEHFEINVWQVISNRFRKVINGKIEANRRTSHIREANNIKEVLDGKADIYVGVGDATYLSSIPDNSIDLIFTDPPHLDNVPYMELSIMWASWLKYKLDFEKEIVVSDSPERNKNVYNYFSLLKKALEEMYRVLKPGKYLVMIFNTADIRWWSKLIELFKETGFEFVASASYESSHPSIAQLSRNATLRGDVYIIFRKNNKAIKSNTQLQKSMSVNILSELIKYAKEIISRENGISTEKLIAKLVAYMLKNYNYLPMQTGELLLELKKEFVVTNGRWYISSQGK